MSLSVFKGDKNLSKVAVKKNARYENDAMLYQATSYGKVGHRQGLGSLLDQKQIEENALKQHERLGDGYLRIAKMGNDGPVQSYINENGLVFKSNDAGVISYVDEGYMIIQKKKKEQQEKYVERILELALTSDEEGAKVCNMSPEDFASVCARGGGVSLGLPSECATYQCNPDFLDYLAPTDPLFYGGIAKLRAIVKASMPIIKSTQETGTTESYVYGNKE